VATLQGLLNRQRITPTLKEDGEFGAQTQLNVIAFQRRAHLVADGIVGSRTWDALNEPSA
jgi:peptidoglycan hydrolase-like protein with peptidoglycan-binding domain